MPPDHDDELLSRKESAAFLGVSVSTFDRMRKDPAFPKPTNLLERLFRWSRGVLRAGVRRCTPGSGASPSA